MVSFERNNHMILTVLVTTTILVFCHIEGPPLLALLGLHLNTEMQVLRPQNLHSVGWWRQKALLYCHRCKIMFFASTFVAE